jgi:ribokinase
VENRVMKACVTGSLVIDITIYPSRNIFLTKETISFPFDYKIQVDKISLDVGGSGFNVAKVLSLLGNKVEFFGKVGNDTYGKMILEEMKKSKISTKNVKTENFLTGFSIVFILGGEKTILTYRGANNLLSEEDLKEETLKKCEWFIFTSMISKENIQFVEKAIKIAKENGIKIVCNPSISMVDYQKEKLLKFIKKSDFIIMNKKEAMKLTKTSEPIYACKKLKKISNSIVIVTMGKKGSILFSDKLKMFKAYKVKVVDTTGAGDSFTAAFVHSFSKTKDIDFSMKFSNAYAALKISKGKGYFPSEKEVLKFMRGEKLV